MLRIVKRRPAATLVALLAVLVGACTQGDDVVDTTTTLVARQTTTTVAEEPLVYRVGMTSGITTVNWWAAMDTEATPENQAVVASSKASLFDLTRPGFVLVPGLAATPEPVPPRPEGEVWVVDQPIREGVLWSDGTPLTAHDFVFYFEVVRDLDLGSFHAVGFPDTVRSVAALGDHLVRVEFDEEPSLTVWPYGVGMAPFVPSHFWEPYVDGAPGRDALYSAEALTEPSIGPLIVEEWSPGEGVVARVNEQYYASGTEVVLFSSGSLRMVDPHLGDIVYGGDASGAVEAHYVAGPFLSGVEWVEHGDADEAYAALLAGDIDFVFDPEGTTLSRYQDLASDRGVSASLSPAPSFRFLAFNLRKPPMSDPVFREAIATVIDKELVASAVFAGTLFPAYTVVHPGLVGSYNPDVSRPGWSGGEPMGEGARFERAITLFAEAGYTWAVEPEVRYDEGGLFVDVLAGEGLTMPNGVRVGELTILAAPVSEEDPLRATFALWIAQWMADLGLEVVTEFTDLNTVAEVAVSPLSSEAALSWDLHLLGWGGADPALPGLTLVALFHSRNTVEAGGLNTTGYQSADFDAAADAFLGSKTVDEAASWTREMERIIAEDLPYVTLFRPSLIEAYRSNVIFPVQSIMGGHASSSLGWPESVRIVR